MKWVVGWFFLITFMVGLAGDGGWWTACAVVSALCFFVLIGGALAEAIRPDPTPGYVHDRAEQNGGLESSEIERVRIIEGGRDDAS